MDTPNLNYGEVNFEAIKIPVLVVALLDKREFAKYAIEKSNDYNIDFIHLKKFSTYGFGDRENSLLSQIMNSIIKKEIFILVAVRNYEIIYIFWWFRKNYLLFCW